MMQSPTTIGSLERFLARPDIEESPAWKFMNGRVQQKPMPTLFHSRLQRNLVNQELPLIYAGDEQLPTLDETLVISVTDIMTMTQRR